MKINDCADDMQALKKNFQKANTLPKLLKLTEI
jgi:hypothetical protein